MNRDGRIAAVAPIEVRGLTKRYGGRVAVNDLSFTVAAGEVCGFLGPNGSGKTTTIGMLLGTVLPTSGAALLFGIPGSSAGASRRRVGAALETPALYPYLSVHDNLRIVAALKEASMPQVDRALDVVGLTARRSDRAATLSMGMRQRLSLAGALVNDPDLLILDEPTNGLDPAGIHDVRRIVKEVAARGATVFLSSHLLAEVQAVCTRVIILNEGRIVGETQLVSADAWRTVVMQAPDLKLLHAAAARYPSARGARIDGDSVLVEVDRAGIADLNRFLVGNGVSVTSLAHRSPNVEDLFLQSVSGAPEGRA